MLDINISIQLVCFAELTALAGSTKDRVGYITSCRMLASWADHIYITRVWIGNVALSVLGLSTFKSICRT